MGFLRKLFGGADAQAKVEGSPAPASGIAAARRAADAESPPVACVVLRQGMDVPDTEYLRKVADAERPGMVEGGVILRGLSQPRWFANEWMESGARIVADALEKELGIDPAKTGYWASTGPDGAKILVVFLRR